MAAWGDDPRSAMYQSQGHASGVPAGSKGDADPGAKVGEPLVVGRQTRI